MVTIEDFEKITERFGISSRLALLLLIFLILGFVIIGISNFINAGRNICGFFRDVKAHFQKRELNNRELKEHSTKLAKKLIDLVSERQGSEPQINRQNWDEYTRRLIRHSQETQNIYFRDYLPEVSKLRGEFLKRNLRDKELDRFYERPTNYIGIQILASRLFELANRLR